MGKNALEHVKPEHLGPLKELVPKLAIGLDVYIFGDAAIRPDYSGRVKLEVIIEGCRFLSELSPKQIREGIEQAQVMGYSKNPKDWDPRELTPVRPLMNRMGELYNVSAPYNVSVFPHSDRIIKAEVIRDGKLTDLMEDQLEYGGVLSYSRWVISYHGAEFEVYATRTELPGSENIRRITTGSRIIMGDDRFGSRERVEKKEW